jgi:hypothetical protein
MTLLNMAAGTYTLSFSINSGGNQNTSPYNKPTYTADLDSANGTDKSSMPYAAAGNNSSFTAGTATCVLTTTADGSLTVTIKIAGNQVMNLWGGGITALSLTRT